jgi:two-component system response regulator DctR
MENIRILIVDEDPMVRDIYRRFISSLEGFVVVSEAVTGTEALALLRHKKVHLLILDIFMPELNGIQTLRAIRKEEWDVDVIIITAAQDGEIIKESARLGVFAYLIKPFTFERFAQTLKAYSQYFRKLDTQTHTFSQADVDGIFFSGDKILPRHLPKGLQPATLEKVISFLQSKNDGISSGELASYLGVSRVTARRYLEYLVSAGRVVMEPVYREWGRPVNRYRML